MIISLERIVGSGATVGSVGMIFGIVFTGLEVGILIFESVEGIMSAGLVFPVGAGTGTAVPSVPVSEALGGGVTIVLIMAGEEIVFVGNELSGLVNVV